MFLRKKLLEKTVFLIDWCKLQTKNIFIQAVPVIYFRINVFEAQINFPILCKKSKLPLLKWF